MCQSISMSPVIESACAIFMKHSDYLVNLHYRPSLRCLKDPSLQVEPYVMVQCGNVTLSDGSIQPTVYQGYIVDLLNHLARVVTFKYRIVPVHDGKFGFEDPKGNWNGMIGELLRGVSSKNA